MFWWLQTFFLPFWVFQMTAAVSQTVSQTAKEAPAPAALTQRFSMSSPRSREKKLTPTACTRSCGTTTRGRSVSCNTCYVRKPNFVFVSLSSSSRASRFTGQRSKCTTICILNLRYYCTHYTILSVSCLFFSALLSNRTELSQSVYSLPPSPCFGCWVQVSAFL